MKKEELLNLIKENPDAEVLIMCGEDSYTGDYAYSAHFLSEASIGVEKLALYDGLYYDDDGELQEEVEDDLVDFVPEEDFQKIVAKEMSKYPFEKYIVIRIG